jgi:acetyl esterase/lipase
VTVGPNDSPGVDVHRDVRYATRPGYRPLGLDLYVPSAGPRGLCVYVHGGGWRMGSRREGPGPLSLTSGRLFERAANRGLAIAAVDYQLSAEASFPAQCHDIAAACTFLAEHGASFGLPDPPITLWGVSAGGLLAALQALDPQAVPPVAAAVCWYPVTDLPSAADDVEAAGGPVDRTAASREGMFLGAAIEDAPELARAASPVQHVRADAPPILLIHGSADVLVPKRQSERLAAALDAVGSTGRLVVVEGYGHMFTGMPDHDVERWVDSSVEFLLDASGRG